MDLRPLSYDEMCQMELLHAAAAAVAAGNASTDRPTAAVLSHPQQQNQTMSGNGSCNSNVTSTVPAAAAVQPTMLPIMVIPTSMMPPGTIFTPATPASTVAAAAAMMSASTPLDVGANTMGMSVNMGMNMSMGMGVGIGEHYYQLHPTHILATAGAAPTAVANANPNETVGMGMLTEGSAGGGSGTTATLLLTPNTVAAAATAMDQQQQQQFPQPQQIPQQQSQQLGNTTGCGGGVQPAPTVNILYAGTLSHHPVVPLTRSALESATLPRGFQPNAYLHSSGNITAPTGAATQLANVASSAAAADESDFEGSECNASVSTTTCIPHFRFGGCGMMLQPTAAMSAHQQHQHQQHHQSHSQQQQQHHHQHEPQVIGCGSFTHMMGSFAAAAGGAMQSSGRFAGTLAGVGAGLSGTLGRNRRGGGASGDGVVQQTPKRVSFKGDNLPPPSPPSPPLMAPPLLQPPPPPPSLPLADEMQLDENGSVVDTFNNCSYMHFDNFMDYQTTGFGGLPDVTEHSNIRRTLSRQNSMSNSDSGTEIASLQKSKVNFGDISKTLASAGAAIVTGGGGGCGGVGGGGSGGGGGGGGGAGSDTGGGVGGIGLAASITSSSTSAKRKSKKAQQQHGGAHHGGSINGDDARIRYKATRRGTLLLSLTLVAALCLLAIAATLAYQHFFMAPSRNSHAQRLRIVRRILRDVPLVDGHNNFAWNVRKYAHSSLEMVHLNRDLDQKSMWTRPTWAQTDIERLRQGLVGVQVWSAYVPCEAQGLDAVQLALEQIDIIRRLSDMYATQTSLVTTSKEIAATYRRGQLASLIGIEGGHTIGSSLGVLRSFYSLGARYLSLTHRCDVSWAGSSATQLESGLSQFGKAIVREMNRLGMMIDLSYSSDATARDVLLATRAPVIFSHSGARQLCNSTRNVPDDILRLVAENGGLIMISFDSEDVTCGRQARLTDVIEHIKYVRSIAGVQHIGLGAGYDGIDMPPIGLEDVSKYPDLLATLLEDHNWSEDDVAMLAGKNFLRIMETVENVRDYWKRAAIQPIEQTEPQPKTQCTYMSS